MPHEQQEQLEWLFSLISGFIKMKEIALDWDHAALRFISHNDIAWLFLEDTAGLNSICNMSILQYFYTKRGGAIIL